MKKILVIFISFLFVFSLSTFAYAAELPAPPDITGLDVEEANALIDEYNAQIDEYNAAVDAEYEAAQADVVAHNEAEDIKVKENEEALAAQDALQAKIEADAAKAIETQVTSAEELPTDWELTEQGQLKTINVTETEEKSGESYRVTNIHGFYDGSSDTYVGTDIKDETFKIQEETTQGMVRAEWETVEVDKNDSVQVISVAKPMGYRSSAFYKRFDGYTNGYWIPGAQEFVYVCDDLSYDWVSGPAYTFSGAYYNVFSFYTYNFVRLGDEPTKVEKYIAEYWDDAVKGEYGTKMDRLVPVVPEPEVEPEPEPEPEPDPEPSEPEVPLTPAPTPSTPQLPENPVVVEGETSSPRVNARTSTPSESTEIIEEVEVPLAKVEEEPETEILPLEEIPKSKPDKPLGREGLKFMNQDEWALVNLILMVLTILALIKFNRKPLIINVFIAVFAVLVFVFTENTFSPMVLVDKYTLYMLVLFVVQVIVRFFGKKDKKEDLD